MTTPPGYNQNVPRVTDDLATSQGNFLENFFQLNAAFSKNHIALNALSLLGNHTVIELAEAPQGFETGAGLLSVYSKDVPGQTDQLFLRYQGNTAEVQLTNYQLYSLPTLIDNPSPRFQFFTVLPGKIMIYFGAITIPAYPFDMSLSPPVAVNIISMNFCPAFTPGYAPFADPVAASNGIISQIHLSASTAVGPTNQTQFYLIMANI